MYGVWQNPAYRKSTALLNELRLIALRIQTLHVCDNNHQLGVKHLYFAECILYIRCLTDNLDLLSIPEARRLGWNRYIGSQFGVCNRAILSRARVCKQ